MSFLHWGKKTTDKEEKGEDIWETAHKEKVANFSLH